MSSLRRNPVHILVLLTAVCLVVASCGGDQKKPPPPQQSDLTPGQQQNDDAPEATPEAEDTPEPQLGVRGISAGHQAAVDAAEQVFEQGGNAVDAAVAASFAIAVVEPVASGIGGGGSAILAGPDGEPVFYDYREVVNNDGEIPGSGSGIPGFVAGMGRLHQDYGELDWEQLIAPAAELAGEGFEVSDYLAERIGSGAGPELLADEEVFAPDGTPLTAGDTLVQPELEQTLQRISEAGWEDYYTGELAESLTEQVDGVDAESLADYEVISSQPVTGTFGDYQVASAAPSLPGAALIQMLQIAEAEGIAESQPDSAEHIDTLSRAWNVAEETIRTDLGDPNFVDVPVQELTDPETNAQLEASGPGNAPQALPQRPEDSAHANTTHISVVDETGLTVSMTNTVTDFWGSGQTVDGYFMNNALDRFSDIDSEANRPEPGRRSVTWSNPTMVLDDQGRPVMAIGTPGGMQILPALATVISQWALQDVDLQDAVEGARFRSEDSLLYLEAGQPTELQTGLEELGWTIEEWPETSFGSIQALVIDHDSATITGADDPRRDGAHSILD